MDIIKGTIDTGILIMALLINNIGVIGINILMIAGGSILFILYLMHLAIDNATKLKFKRQYIYNQNKENQRR